MNLDVSSLLGGLTGNNAVRAQAAGALVKVEGALASKATKVGELLGGKFGSHLFDSLAKGAKSGETKTNDAVAQENIGVTLSGIKQAGKWALIAIGGALVILGFIVAKKLKIVPGVS